MTTNKKIAAKSVPPKPAPRIPATRQPAQRKTASRQPAAKQRLSPAERERQIIEGAIDYFAEVGFSGQTRELSKRLGITQPLLYRYFPSKQALVERVYSTVFEGRWNPKWPALLADRSLPLRDRLVEFYRQYSIVTYRPEWIRIYMYAGLSGTGLNRRYIGMIQRELLTTYCRELREYCGIHSGAPVSQEEMEFVWSLHGGMFYYAVRRSVYKINIKVDFMTKVGYAVDNFLAGAKTTLPALIAAVQARRT